MSNLFEKRSNSDPKNNRRKQNQELLLQPKGTSPKKINNNNNIKLISDDFDNENKCFLSIPIKPLEEKKIENFFFE